MIINNTNNNIRKLDVISCIIPALNEEDNLNQLIPRLYDSLDGIYGAKLEVIIIDDGSTDNSISIYEKFKDKELFNYIKLSRNFGKEAALTAGLDLAIGEVVAILDADMQHPPETIVEMISIWQSGYDMVYTYRKNRQDESILKRLGSSLFYKIMNDSRSVIPKNSSDFRLMDRKVVDALKMLPEKRRFMKGLYAWVGFTSKGIPYVPEERVHGKSKFSLTQLVVFAINGMTSYNTFPLRISVIAGLLIAVIGFITSIVSLIIFIVSDSVTVFDLILVISITLIGFILVNLAILGEHLGGIMEEVKNRPIYLIDKHLNDKKNNKK